MSFRDDKRNARRVLHSTMQVPALYFEPDSAVSIASPTPVTVRVHSQITDLGDMQGTSLAYAERAEQVPRVIFMLADLSSASNGGVFSIQAGEAYKIDSLDPADDITQTARVTRMRKVECCDFPVPPLPAVVE